METNESIIKNTVDSINDYVNGNDTEENYQVILDTVDGLFLYLKTLKENRRRATITFLVSKLATIITCPSLMKEDIYKEIMKLCKIDYNFYLESAEKYKNYVMECEAKGEYPDLDAAFLLSINLSFLYRACMNYLSYIRTLESCYRNDIAFQTDISNNALKEKEEVKRLIMVTDAAIEELRQRED